MADQPSERAGLTGTALGQMTNLVSGIVSRDDRPPGNVLRLAFPRALGVTDRRVDSRFPISQTGRQPCPGSGDCCNEEHQGWREIALRAKVPDFKVPRRTAAIDAISTVFRRNFTILASSSHRHNYRETLLIFFVYCNVKSSKWLDSFVPARVCVQQDEGL
ncbi:hypothetical protein [Burkholderia pyrrocinia]|uniref:hypothetical protein n=1 Tax=Burkholderia pyrrocinia TaxID=60550 RepID=UPI0012601AFB|nr:hypothetical protein [Burkholderia pyrrocinia]